MSTYTENNDAKKHPDYLVNMKYITTLTGMTDKWFYALIKRGKFPRPIKFGRASRWRLRDIESWIESKTN